MLSTAVGLRASGQVQVVLNVCGSVCSRECCAEILS